MCSSLQKVRLNSENNEFDIRGADISMSEPILKDQHHQTSVCF